MNNESFWPENILEGDKQIFEKDLTKNEPAPFVLHKLNRSVLSKRGLFHNYCIPSALAFPDAKYPRIILWRHLKFIPRIIRFLGYYARYLLSPFNRMRVFKSDESQKFVLVSDLWSVYYFHWFSDSLPRLARLLSHQSIPEEEICLILPANHNLSYISGSLDVLGIKHILLPPDRNAYFHELHIPSHCGLTGTFNYSMEPVRNLFRNRISDGTQPQIRKNIYISRAKARCRSVVNEDLIVPLLDQYGYEVVHLEEHSWSRQLELMGAADIIIAPHGGGLTNMLFLEKGSIIVELKISETDFHNNCFFNMANVLGHRYYYLMCRNAGTSVAPGDDNMIVDPCALRRLLSRISRSNLQGAGENVK